MASLRGGSYPESVEAFQKKGTSSGERTRFHVRGRTPGPQRADTPTSEANGHYTQDAQATPGLSSDSGTRRLGSLRLGPCHDTAFEMNSVMRSESAHARLHPRMHPLSPNESMQYVYTYNRSSSPIPGRARETLRISRKGHIWLFVISTFDRTESVLTR